MIDTQTNTGKPFERTIADKYRKLGARKVEHDVEIAGHQIDVYVEFDLPGNVIHRMAIETKDYQSSVGINIISKFSTMIRRLRERGDIDSGVILAAKGFTKPARNHAEQLRYLRLLEPSDLDSSIEGSSPKPDIRVVPNSCTPLYLGNIPNPTNPKTFIGVGIQNHSSQTVFIHSLFYTVSCSDMRYMVVRDAYTNQYLNKKELPPGESYHVTIDPLEIAGGEFTFEQIEDIFVIDAIGRTFHAMKEELENAVYKLKSWYPV